MLFTYDELRARRNAEFYYLWGRCPDMDPPPEIEEKEEDLSPYDQIPERY